MNEEEIKKLKLLALDNIRATWGHDGMDDSNDMTEEESREAVYTWFMDFTIPKVMDMIINKFVKNAKGEQNHSHQNTKPSLKDGKLHYVEDSLARTKSGDIYSCGLIENPISYRKCGDGTWICEKCKNKNDALAVTDEKEKKDE